MDREKQKFFDLNNNLRGKVMEEINKITFEESMKNLETIVNELEKGDLSLDESVKKFEEGIKISKECNNILESAEKKISILLQNDEEISEENFVEE